MVKESVQSQPASAASCPARTPQMVGSSFTQVLALIHVRVRPKEAWQRGGHLPGRRDPLLA